MKTSFLISVKTLARTAMLLALTLAIQGFGFPPAITGPLVNFMLILSTILAGTAGGVVIGSVTPWIALIVGILPVPLAPAVPFIMLGNAAYCLLFGLLYRAGALRRWLGVIAASLAKFIIIAGAVQLLLALPAPLVQVLMFPQLINALAGGIAALGAGIYLQRIAVAAGSDLEN